MAKYLLSVLDHEANHESPDSVYGYESREVAEASWAETGKFNDRLKDDGYFVFADGLADRSTATVVDGQGETPIFTDGPYTESKEFIGGIWIIEAPDLDVALELAAEGSKACSRRVEVRPFNIELDV